MSIAANNMQDIKLLRHYFKDAKRITHRVKIRMGEGKTHFTSDDLLFYRVLRKIGLFR